MRAFLLRDEKGRATGIWAIIRDITERKRMEQMLVEEKNRAQNLLDIAGVIILALDTDGVVTLINKRGCEILNRSKEEITGKVWVDSFIPQGVREGIKGVFRTLRTDGVGTVGRYENPILGAGGEERIISWDNTVIRDKAGTITGTLSSGEDITERKKTEEALLKANSYNRSLIEASLDPLVTIGPDGKITDVNKATEEVTGYSREHLIGTDFSDYFTEADRAREGYRQAFRDGLVRDFPLELRHRDGHETSVLYNASVYRDETGNITGIFAAARDVTEQKKVREALKNSEIRFRSLIQNSSDIIRILDTSGYIVYDSPSSRRLLGFPEGFFVGKNILDFIHPDDITRVKTDLTELISKKNSGLPTEFRARKADGEYIYVESVGVNLIGVTGIDGIVITTRPIQERKLAELALHESEEQYRLLFENAQEAIFLHAMLPDGRPGRFLMVNPILFRQLGYSREELMQMSVTDIISKNHPSVVPEIVKKVKNEGHATFEDVLRRKDGSEFPVEVRYSSFRAAWQERIALICPRYY